jgi:cytoskeletal protein CcmA (bactofilin family)
MFLNIGAARDQRIGRAGQGVWPDAAAEAHTIIHADLSVTGELLTDGHLEVNGRIDGTTNSHSILVSEGGWVEGTILADFAEIRGTVVGAVRATTVLIGSNARVLGSIFHNTLTIEPGAQLEGRRPWRPHIDRKRESA